ncbi:MAG: preprotein translocase subunit YajC [Phycisphaerales bacterium]|nr:preprotein translocase subunit YajC [Planctomycetota bacterium]MBL6997856.1 preprotein translocase subunit YajC [Phycisphaerales bacterium]
MYSTSPTDIIATMVLTQFSGEEAAQGTTTTEGADGSPLGTEGAQPNPLGGNFFTIMMVVLVGMIVFSMFGGRKQKKKRSAMLDSLQKRDTVLTRGGVFGTIVEIKPDRLVLKVDESSNTRITVLRDSIEQVTADTNCD